MAAVSTVEVDFNSSDIEFEPREDLFTNAGFNTIQQMQLNRAQDRVLSKKDWKALDLTFASPSTQYAYKTWANAWDSYWSSLDLRDALPSNEHIVRFLSNTMRRMTPRYKDKYGDRLSSRTMGDGFMWITKHLEYTYKEWQVTRHLQTKVSSFINQAVQDGRLFRGRKMDRRWVGFAMCQMLLQEFFSFMLRHGCLSWDIVVSEALSVALMVALDCRGGDILRAKRSDEHQVLSFSAIKLYLEGGQSVEHLLAHCTIKFEKGMKQTTNENRARLLSPLGTSAYNCTDPVLLLVIHCLRNGLFLHGPDISTVLRKASFRQDKTVEWRYPDWPVTPQIKYGKLQWPKPASQSQLMGTTRKLGLCAGVLEPLKPHDFRRGSVRDLSRISKKLFTNVHAAAGKAAGHSKGSVANGTTSSYAGDELNPLNKNKASLPTRESDKLGFTYAEPFAKRKKRPSSEIDAAIEARDAQQTSMPTKDSQSKQAIKSDRRKVAKDLQEKDLETWRAQDPPRDQPVAVPGIPARTVAETRKRKTQDDSTTIVNIGNASDSYLSQEVSEIDQEMMMEALFVRVEEIESTMDNEIEEGDDSTLVNLAVAMTLDAVNSKELAGKQESPLCGSTEDFVQFFSTFNIVRNANVKGGWTPSDEQWAKHVDIGHSRNPPSRFQFPCLNTEAGCGQVCYTDSDARVHAEKCKFDPLRITDHLSDARQAERLRIAPKLEEYRATARAKHACDYEGCTRNFTGANHLEVHKIEHACEGHTRCPKMAECGDSTDFKTALDLRRHYEGHHTMFAIEARACPKIPCSRKELFTSSRKLAQHLRDVHKIPSKDQVALLG